MEKELTLSSGRVIKFKKDYLSLSECRYIVSKCIEVLTDNNEKDFDNCKYNFISMKETFNTLLFAAVLDVNEGEDYEQLIEDCFNDCLMKRISLTVKNVDYVQELLKQTIDFVTSVTGAVDSIGKGLIDKMPSDEALDKLPQAFENVVKEYGEITMPK